VPRDAVPVGSIALALGGLPPEELPRLRACIAESTDTAARMAAPVLFDLTGPEDAPAAPDPQCGAMPGLPAVTAAANVLGAPWGAPGIAVELTPTCDASAARCVPLFASAVDRGDALVRRGLALAWTLGNAARLRVASPSRAPVVRSLRQAQTRPGSTIALVFDAPRGVLDAAELERLHEEARRSLADIASDAPQRPWLDALGAARASWELPVALDADEVLVIPRLSVLARLQDFRAEIERARDAR
jgi:hypothetical protein